MWKFKQEVNNILKNDFRKKWKNNYMLIYCHYNQKAQKWNALIDALIILEQIILIYGI